MAIGIVLDEENNDGQKGCFQLFSNDTFLYNICFGGLKTAEEVIAEGLYCCRPVKMTHKIFCLDRLGKLMI